MYTLSLVATVRKGLYLHTLSLVATVRKGLYLHTLGLVATVRKRVISVHTKSCGNSAIRYQ